MTDAVLPTPNESIELNPRFLGALNPDNKSKLQLLTFSVHT